MAAPLGLNIRTMKALFRTELIYAIFEANVTAGAFVAFPDQPLLDGNYLMGIEAVTADMLIQIPDQIDVTTDLTAWTLSLSEGSDQKFGHNPMAALFPPANGGIWKEFVPFIVNWQRSGVTYVGTAPLDARYAVPFIAHYATPQDFLDYLELCNKLGIAP